MERNHIKRPTLQEAREAAQRAAMREAVDSRVAQSESRQLLERWGKKIRVIESAAPEKTSRERELCLAKTLNSMNEMLKLQESIQTADAGIFKLFALDMVGAVVQNLIAPEIVSVQGMDNAVALVLYLEYQYGTTKGTTQAGTAFADTRNFYQADAQYSSSNVEGEIVQLAATTGKATLAQPAPISAGSVSITLSNGTTVLTDDGAGNLADAGNSVTGTINYATGEITIASAQGTAVTANYTYALTYVDNAVTNRIPEVNLQMKRIPMYAKPRRMKAVWSFDSQYILNKEYGGADMEELMNATVAAEIMHEIDMEVMNDLYRCANAGPEQTWSEVVPFGISATDHFNTFKVAIDRCSAQIYKATRKVRGNFIVGGVEVGTVCSSVIGFKPAKNTTIAGPCFFGTMPDGVKVYLNPDFDNDVFVVGYKGSNMFDTGYILGMYMPVCTTPMVQLEDMAGRKGWAASYGKAVVNNRMYIRGRITH